MRSTKKYPGSVYLKRFNTNICFGNVLIALLVVLIIPGIIVGVLVAMEERFSSRHISCGGKADRYEGKNYVGSMNRAQQAYYLENGTFVASIPKLGLGIQTKTKNYEYFVRATKTAVFNYGIAQKTASEPLKSYVGAVFLVSPSRLEKKKLKKKVETLGILCETSSPTSNIPADPTYKNGVLTCGENIEYLRY